MKRLTLPTLVFWFWMFLTVPLVAEAQSGADKRLLQKTSIAVEAKPVEDVLRDLGEKHKLVVEFDPSVAMNDVGKTPITLTADGVTLASMIHLVCSSNELAYFAEKGRLFVSTLEADRKNLVNREYPLAPLGEISDVQEFMAGLQRVTST